MMTNLFSVFDPSTGYMSLNWMSTFLLILIPTPFWNSPSKTIILILKYKKMITSEVMTHTKSKTPSIIFISMMTMILINNIMGMMPYVFTSSAHLSFSLTLALNIWLAIMLYGWWKNPNSMFSHLVPMGTPNILMPFMIIIETISNFIRPGSLAVRLTANMIAGHLLMTLLGNNSSNSNMVTFLIMWLFMGLMMFECAVAFIQSYVFMTLSTLYSSEI